MLRAQSWKLVNEAHLELDQWVSSEQESWASPNTFSNITVFEYSIRAMSIEIRGAGLASWKLEAGWD